MATRPTRSTSAARPVRLALVVAGIALAPGLVHAQVSPEEHAKHHPGAAEPGPPSTIPPAGPMSGAVSGDGPPGGMGGMGGMMKSMGVPPPKDLYPSLMSLPDLPPERRAEVERQAHGRMEAGTALLSEGLERLARAAPTDDFAAMQAATATMREGLAQFESGLAAHRALAEGKAPRSVALQWFKREMNLASPMPSDAPRALLGATPFHLFSMVLLVVFALVMVALYFAKMRRAAALFGRIEASKGAPPPGSAPALAGTTPPPAAKGNQEAST